MLFELCFSNEFCTQFLEEFWPVNLLFCYRTFDPIDCMSLGMVRILAVCFDYLRALRSYENGNTNICIGPTVFLTVHGSHTTAIFIPKCTYTGITLNICHSVGYVKLYGWKNKGKVNIWIMIFPENLHTGNKLNFRITTIMIIYNTLN